VAQIVRQRRSLGKLRHKTVVQERLLEKQIVRDRAGNLRRFDAVSQARSIEVRLSYAKDLRFPLKPPERGAVQNAIPVSLGRMPMVFRGNRILVISPL
jgi:hypothetical protein